MDIKEWLIEWFSKHSSLDIENIKTSCKDCNYMEQGIIDSFSFVMLLSDIDDEYGISFTNDDFLSPDFMTIDGLAKLIEERKGA